MRQLLDRLGRGRSFPAATQVPFVRWSEVDLDEPGPLTIADVLDQRHDGFLIKGVLTPDEAATARAAFAQHVDEWHQVGYGGTWGQPVNASWDGDRTAYLASAPRVISDYREAFGFDIGGRLTQAFHRLSGPFAVGVAEENGATYLPGSFREMKSGFGGLPAHTGNEFFEMGADGPLNHLRAVTRWENSLSWFLMIEPPERGGELRLYDLKWEDRPEIRGFDNFRRDDSPFDDIPTAVVRPEAGDLVWFRGGNVWHKVAQIRGRRSRVTFGGFMAPLLDADRLVYWS